MFLHKSRQCLVQFVFGCCWLFSPDVTYIHCCCCSTCCSTCMDGITSRIKGMVWYSIQPTPPMPYFGCLVRLGGFTNPAASQRLTSDNETRWPSSNNVVTLRGPSGNFWFPPKKWLARLEPTILTIPSSRIITLGRRVSFLLFFF